MAERIEMCASMRAIAFPPLEEYYMTMMVGERSLALTNRICARGYGCVDDACVCARHNTRMFTQMN